MRHAAEGRTARRLDLSREYDQEVAAESRELVHDVSPGPLAERHEAPRPPRMPTATPATDSAVRNR
jgi:hypothetical protein